MKRRFFLKAGGVLVVGVALGDWPLPVIAQSIPDADRNAVFDATGVRLREVPFRPERVKAALIKEGTR